MDENQVAPFTGAWIEIYGDGGDLSGHHGSHPSRVRGLKSKGNVSHNSSHDVAPFTGAWIEI